MKGKLLRRELRDERVKKREKEKNFR